MGKIRKLLLERKIELALFQETKKASLSSVDVKRVWLRDKMEYMVVDAEGQAGGLLCIWDPEMFQLSNCCSNRSFILLASTVLSSFECVVINVYAPNDTVGGEFNEIRNLDDRVGCSRKDRGMKDFNDFIDRYELTEIQMMGRKFTWCNAIDGNKWSKIDRFLLSLEWLERFKLKLWGLPRLISDHCPLVLLEDDRDWGPKPFKFTNAWLLHPNFASFLVKVWQETQINGRACFILHRKLHALKLALKN
ncbi:uncharacterized protein LOC114277537 [Camellia sinensis]|uniref:uncharacterized protein LOC114277537 n=1 Tax=Camellia sinensis TaxID=4442 RepID=UPI001035A305|nr:uncharacterized protein LOC114277537 [Camellia sinensis]